MKFIDASLDRFCETKLRIQEFRLLVGVLDVEKSFRRVDRWIGLAIENGVKELDLEVITDGSKVYSYPETIFSAKSVTTLKLSGCKLEQPSDIIRFNSLKHLTLVRVYINEQLVQRLTSECPLLEDLLLSLCTGFKRLHVSKADKLKIIEVKTFPNSVLESVEIDVPSLQELVLTFLGPTPRLVDLIGCPHLKKLKLGNVNITDKEFHHFISKFPLLEDLCVRHFPSVEKIVILNNWLKGLTIQNCRNLKAIDIDTPKLLYLCCEFEPFPSASVNAPCLWNVNLRFSGVLSACWFRNLKEFLELFNQIEELTISVTSGKSPFNSDELRESLNSLLCQVRNLVLTVDERVLPSDYLALLDGVLWICYPRTLCIPSRWDKEHKFLKWLWETLKNRDSTCCNSGHIKRWQRDLKEIKIESFTEDTVDGWERFNIDLMNIWQNLPRGIMLFDLDWSEGFNVQSYDPI